MSDNQAFTPPPVYASHDFFGLEEPPQTATSTAAATATATATPPYSDSAAITRAVDLSQQYDYPMHIHVNPNAETPQGLHRLPYESRPRYDDPYFHSQPYAYGNPTNHLGTHAQPYSYRIVTEYRDAQSHPVSQPYADDPAEEEYEDRGFRYDDYGRLIELQGRPTTPAIQHRPEPVRADYPPPTKSYEGIMVLACVVMWIFCLPLGLMAYRLASKFEKHKNFFKLINFIVEDYFYEIFKLIKNIVYKLTV